MLLVHCKTTIRKHYKTNLKLFSSSIAKLNTSEVNMAMQRGSSVQKQKSGKQEIPLELASRPYVDTHVHLDHILKESHLTLRDFPKLQESFGNQYRGCINNCCFPNGLDMCEKLSQMDKVYASFGVHPHSAKEYNDKLEVRILQNMKSDKTVAWGECGLDFFKNMSPPDVQQKVFARQMELAVQLHKPLIVHTRNAEDETFLLMSKWLPKDHHIHIHCFTGTTPFALKLIENFDNLWIGFTGAITFNKAVENRETVKQVPLERLLLETDGPFMAPEPHRGKPAHPGHIGLVAKTVAKVKDIPVETVLDQALLNAQKMYGCFQLS